MSITDDLKFEMRELSVEHDGHYVTVKMRFRDHYAAMIVHDKLNLLSCPGRKAWAFLFKATGKTAAALFLSG